MRRDRKHEPVQSSGQICRQKCCLKTCPQTGLTSLLKTDSQIHRYRNSYSNNEKDVYLKRAHKVFKLEGGSQEV